MSATPESGPTDYPDAWKPRHIREREEQRTEFERSVAALSDEEIARIRGGDR